MLTKLTSVQKLKSDNFSTVKRKCAESADVIIIAKWIEKGKGWQPGGELSSHASVVKKKNSQSASSVHF